MQRLTFILLTIFLVVRCSAADIVPFAIEVVDDDTGRGVPLVELETVDRVRFITDSAGVIAFNEPGLMGHKVFFTVSSFGYEFPPDGFGFHGVALDVKPGGSAKLKIKRINIAERIYRVTGAGIYRDTVLAGRKPPIKQPLLNTQVVGQDSVNSIVYRGNIWFFWGDTSQLRYPLGNFSTTAATSELPGRGGLDPNVGINLNYLTNEEGFTKRMVPLPEPGLVWIDGVFSVKDDAGKPRMLAHFSRMESLTKRLERGLIVFNDEKQIFEKLKPIDLDATLAPGGHPFKAKVDGVEYIYFTTPYPNTRVKADWQSATNLAEYEGLVPGPDGKFIWKKKSAPLGPKEMAAQIKEGKIRTEDAPLRLKGADSGKAIELHNCSVYWNDYRERYIMIASESMGDSVLGEVWFVESKNPEGPWQDAKKVATHHRMIGTDLAKHADNQDLYNPKHHDFFDQEGGRIIYFEGTYTHSFAGNPVQTPRYEYNQLMYRLDLSDPRLKLPK